LKSYKDFILYIGLFSCLLVGIFLIDGKVTASVAETPVLLKINDYYVLYTTPKAPYVDTHNRLMIPLRSISELLGANVSYHSTSKKVTIKTDVTVLTYEVGSQNITVNDESLKLDTIPVNYNNSVFIPISSLAKHLNIQSKWDQAAKLYTLTTDNFTQSAIMKNIDEFDRSPWSYEGPVQSNKSFAPLSYVVDSKNNVVTIKSKNISGVDVPKGSEDVHPYFVFGNSVQFDKIDRERLFVKKDGVSRTTWAVTPSTVNGKKETLQYILVQGRTLEIKK
jgi:hypothetical protein